MHITIIRITEDLLKELGANARAVQWGDMVASESWYPGKNVFFN